MPVQVALLLFCTATLAFAQDWKPLFDGKSLDGWKITAFTEHGTVKVEDGAIVMSNGKPLTGINYTGTFPKLNYEVQFEARRVDGNDFFASLTLPYNDSFFTFVTGGWGGDIIGISSIDGWDASDNETRQYFNFDRGRWYKFRLAITKDKMVAWIDDQKVIDLVINGRAISMRRGDIGLSTPVGFSSYGTIGAIRKIEYRAISR